MGTVDENDFEAQGIPLEQLNEVAGGTLKSGRHKAKKAKDSDIDFSRPE